MFFEYTEVAPLGVNCFVIGCEETGKGVIVDPGGDAHKIIAMVDGHKLEICAILNTHGHFDHVGANRAIVDRYKAPLMIHQADAGMLQRVKEVSSRYGIPGGVDSPAPDSFLEDGQEIAIGNLKIKVLHTPGHTQGGCCLYLESEKRVITGDTLFEDSIGRTDLPGGNHEQLLSSIRTKLFTLADDVTVYPGHGPATTIGYEKQNNPYF